MIGEHAIGTQTFGAQAGELAVCGIYGLGPDEPERYLRRMEAITRRTFRPPPRNISRLTVTGLALQEVARSNRKLVARR